MARDLGQAPPAAVAIFEIEVGTGSKHRAGGIAFPNVVALSGRRRIRSFATSRGRNQLVTSDTVELFATRLGDRWRLDPVVIPSFIPAVIRERVRARLAREFCARRTPAHHIPCSRRGLGRGHLH